MPATITAYTTFTGGTRARASQVNENFQNHRGTLLPVEADTAAASNNEHDIGSTDHQWNKAYLNQAPYVNGVQTNRFAVGDVFDGSSVTELVEPIGDLGRIAFPTDRDTDVRFQFVVPPTYRIGNRIALTMRGYPETTGSAVFYSTSRLHRTGTTSIVGTSTPANVLTGTSTITNASAGLIQEDSALKLTDANGLINSVTVTVGDILSVGLKRATSHVSDTNAGKWFLTDLIVDLNN